MTEEKKPVPGLRSLLEDTLGLKIDDALRARIETTFGTTLDDDPGRWTDVKRSLAVQAGEDPDAEGIVDAVVTRLAAELGSAGGDSIPVAWTPAERAVYATRAVEAALEEGGPEGLRDEARSWVGAAVEGYRLLGLPDHAAVTERIGAALGGPLGEDEVDDLMEDWLNVENADGPRAAWIAAHPEAFRG
jgi:hypothetical protein